MGSYGLCEWISQYRFIVVMATGVLRLVPRRQTADGITPSHSRTVLTFNRWGQPFLHHTFLHHLTRLDHRHNFSPYSYPIYLSLFPRALGNGDPSGHLQPLLTFLRHPLTSFLPQASLVLAAGILTLETGLGFAMFVQTATFVVFNKVCTSQVSLPFRGIRRSSDVIYPWIPMRFVLAYEGRGRGRGD